MAIAREGWRGYWNDELCDAITHDPPDHCDIVHIHAHLGDKDQVLDLLESVYREHCGDTTLKIGPLYDFVRSEPRFQAVLRQVGFPD